MYKKCTIMSEKQMRKKVLKLLKPNCKWRLIIHFSAVPIATEVSLKCFYCLFKKCKVRAQVHFPLFHYIYVILFLVIYSCYWNCRVILRAITFQRACTFPSVLWKGDRLWTYYPVGTIRQFKMTVEVLYCNHLNVNYVCPRRQNDTLCSFHCFSLSLL